ncbi:MAG: penicillin-binding transpeptidase domain-containing protein, partial [Candidatus Uhrbacteria bacterium]|nr:penicillin-binding transpeptidase domain-containing protein [Candidatus Uhrbacteria bacterium]
EGVDIRTLSRNEKVDGTDLTLAIDERLQAAIEYILSAGLETLSTKRASVIAMQPDTGEILALVSYPSYDANLFTDGISTEAYAALVNDPNTPLFPRATSGGYPSGSTIKPVYAAAALMERIIEPSTSFFSSGGIWVGPKFYPDWRAGGHGATNVYHAIADSVNTFFYIIGGGNESFSGMGLETLMRYAALFGLGSPSGIDLPNELAGFLPSKAWKEETKGEQWYIGDTYNVSIGQGDLLVSPLQIARSTAVFANGGNLVTPHLSLAAPTETVDILPDDVYEVVRDAMRQTITNGSGTMLNGLPVDVAGKTGTAQWSNAAPPHSWFTGFAPFDDPEIVITVIIEQGGDHALALPISYKIFDWWYENRQRDLEEQQGVND